MDIKPKRTFKVDLLGNAMFEVDPKTRVELPGAKHVPMPSLAKKNCKQCYGRGIMGRDNVTKIPVVCTCCPRNLEEKYDAHKQ